MTSPRKYSTLCVIPARGAHDVVSRLNLRELNGKPLLQYTIEAARHATAVDAIIVSTEDDSITEFARACGADVPFLRPTELTTDHASMAQVVQHALQHVSDTYDIVLVLSPNCPLRRPEDINAIVAYYLDHPFDFVFSMIEDRDYFWTMEDHRFTALTHGAGRSTCAPLYRAAGGMEIGWRKNFLQKELYASSVGGCMVDRYTAFTIHSLYDLFIAERLVRLPRALLDTLGLAT